MAEQNLDSMNNIEKLSKYQNLCITAYLTQCGCFAKLHIYLYRIPA